MQEVIEVLLRGLFHGITYAVAATGLALVFGVMRVVNVAHGELFMLGGYIAYVLWSALGLNPLLGMLVSGACLAVIGTLLQRFLVEQVVGKPETTSLLLLFGVSIILMDMARGIFTTGLRSIVYLQEPVSILGASYAANNLVTLAVGIFLAIALALFLKFHPLGKALRATAQNQELVSACGIDSRKIRMFSFALAACLAGIAGVLWAMLHNLSPFTGQAIIITLFAVVVLGGLGSITGAFLGGIALGLAEVATAHYFTPQLSLFVAYAVLIAMLLLRPRGLMGASVEAE